MASSSTSSTDKRYKYDVFLSFRGEDTRKNFVDHLNAALQRQGIHTYKDDERIEKGKRISDELIKSIEDSKFFIIVFSKNYASSSWCLEELEKIMECQKTTEQTAYPVFYDVEPSEVRKQSGAVGEAFSKHKKEEAAWKWREALEEAANLAGWELKNTTDGHEAKFIQKIVEEISLALRSINSGLDEKLIGMEMRIKDVESILETGYDDVTMIGIKGMGGGGKTTLARAVYDQISIRFECGSFVENVREVSETSLSTLKLLQKQILSDVLNDQGITVSSVHDGKSKMKMRLGRKKVLIVLDDVSHIDQLEALAGAPNWFKFGSKIIITTRDEQVLVAHGVKLIYDVNLLSHTESICLFSRYAFGREIPIQGYEKLSRQVVSYAAGLPLTIRVLGSFLCGKDNLEWIDALERLKTIPLKETLEKLELSYVSLEDDYKEIFLDVACFLKGSNKNDAITILESCGYHARNGLRVLEQKSLITTSSTQCIGMHDHIEEMGRNIVRRLHVHEPNRHSRLWIRDEIEDIVSDDLDSEATRCIIMWELQRSSEIVMKGFGNMLKLKCLMVVSQINNDYSCEHVKIDEVSHYLPNALRFLRWDRYPHRSLPKTFRANKLVALELPYSRIVQLWEGGERKVLYKLKILNLGHSKVKTLDLGLTPNIERLDLQDCHDLVEVHVSVGCLKSLLYLNLGSCSRFLNCFFIKWLESLENFFSFELHLIEDSRCCHDGSHKLQLTCFYKELPSSIGMVQKFLSLYIFSFTKLSLGSTCGKQLLRKLKLKCYILEVLEDLDHLESLEELSLVSVHKHIPDCIFKLKHLKTLKLKFRCLLEKLPEDLGRLQFLEKLSLLCTFIKHLPDSICTLRHLKSLELKCCWLLEKLPEDLGRLECLEKLILMKCTSLGYIPNSICEMKRLRCFRLPFCFRVEKLPEELGHLKCLQELNVANTDINYLPHSVSLLKGLLIVGPKSLLQSSGFTSKIETSIYGTFSYVDDTHPQESPLTCPRDDFQKLQK